MRQTSHPLSGQSRRSRAEERLCLQIALRKTLADNYDHDLDRWRKAILSKRASRDYIEGFQLLDMNNKAMWDLLKQLMAYEPNKRLTAAAALQHQAFGTGLVGHLNVVLSSVGSAAEKVSSQTEHFSKQAGFS